MRGGARGSGGFMGGVSGPGPFGGPPMAGSPPGLPSPAGVPPRGSPPGPSSGYMSGGAPPAPDAQPNPASGAPFNANVQSNSLPGPLGPPGYSPFEMGPLQTGRLGGALSPMPSGGVPFSGPFPNLAAAGFSSIPLGTPSFSASVLGSPMAGGPSLSTAQLYSGAPLSSASLLTSMPGGTPSSPFQYTGSASMFATPMTNGAQYAAYPMAGSPTAADVSTPAREGNQTINISNTGWEKAVEDLKKELDLLKSEGGMAALRELLQSKVEELEKCRQSEMVKEKELHRLQDMYAEEIRKHTEDLARVRKAEADLQMIRQAEAERLRVAQQEQERAAASALAQLEAMRQAELAKPKTPKKKKKKGTKKSPQKSPPRVGVIRR